MLVVIRNIAHALRKVRRLAIVLARTKRGISSSIQLYGLMGPHWQMERGSFAPRVRKSHGERLVQVDMQTRFVIVCSSYPSVET
jgi:hypothetical protein